MVLYEDQGELGRAFASLHQRLDAEFDWMNHKAWNGSSGHFNADNSRSLIELAGELDVLRKALQKAGRTLRLSDEYQRVINGSKEFLRPSGGSPIPEGFTPILVEKYEPVFHLDDAEIVLADRSRIELTHVGDGAYAVVHKFVDPNYGKTFARKKLKTPADARDIERFRREYETMKRLHFPYILEVYQYDEAENAYTMEYCDETLENYVKRRNNHARFDFNVRRRIALQFLYGLNYLHREGVLHRDLSLRNILLRVYPDGGVIVKLSDFGLAKIPESDFTKTETEIRGTIVDPALDRFKDYQPVNDIYAVGFVLSFIFTGSKRLLVDRTPLGKIIQKCSHIDPSQRYRNVLEIIKDVENLKADPDGTPA